MNTKALKAAACATIALVVAIGCSQSTTPDGAQARISEQALATDTVPGYTHTLPRSRFALGGNRSEKTEVGLQKTIGDNGVFATLVTSGWTMAIPNGNAPTRLVAPLSASADVHNQAVKDYFASCGIPLSQIGSVVAHGSVYGTMGPQDTSGPPPMHFANYSSVLSRSVDGVPIADSFAWAIINADNDVVEEAVYWPAIPKSVVDDAAAFQTMLTDPTRGAGFLNALPKSFPPGQVVVHHTPCVGGPAEAVATYDVLDRGTVGMARQRHFASTGQEVILASESAPIPPNTPKGHR
jgi:hypothetical protein